MARLKANDQLTPLELEIMQVLWLNDALNVQSVQQQLGRTLAYTTVQTMLNILHRKGKVERTLNEKAYFYRPTVSRGEIVSQTVEDLLARLFGGSAQSLVMSMVENEQLTPDELSRVNEIIEKEAGDSND